MDPQTGTIIGYIAATLTTSAFVPQAWMAWKTKRTDGVSLGMYLVFCLGISLWLVYGIVILSWPLIIANAVSLLLSLSILIMKLRYG